jgi:hypothetical protein
MAKPVMAKTISSGATKMPPPDGEITLAGGVTRGCSRVLRHNVSFLYGVVEKST